MNKMFKIKRLCLTRPDLHNVAGLRRGFRRQLQMPQQYKQTTPDGEFMTGGIFRRNQIASIDVKSIVCMVVGYNVQRDLTTLTWSIWKVVVNTDARGDFRLHINAAPFTILKRRSSDPSTKANDDGWCKNSQRGRHDI